MSPYMNDLMTGVIVASTAFAGLTMVMLGYVHSKQLLVKASRLSLGCGIVAVMFAILWFYFGQLEFFAAAAVILLLIQMFAAWMAVDELMRFWEQNR